MPGKGFKLADAYVEVHGDGTTVVDEVASDVEKDSGKSKGAGMSMGKKLVGGLIGAIAVAKIGAFISDSISSASDLNETVSASKAIFGAQAGAMEKWAGTAAKSFGLSKQAALDSATSFGDMLLQIGYTGDAAKTQSQHVVQMAADLGSFKNLDTSEVLDMISASMRGEYDSLQRVIPNINAARVQQEALSETGKKSVSQLTAQEKAQATLNIINKDGSRAMGDFAKTSNGVANSQKIAAAQTEDLKASLGASLLPIVQQILSVVNTTFLPMLQGLASWIGKNKDIIGPLVIVFGALAAAIWIVNIAMYANPISLIIMGIIALIAVIVLVITNFDNLKNMGIAIFNFLINWIVGVLEGFVGWWNGIWAAVGQTISDVWNGIVSWITDAINNVVAWVQAHWGLLLSFIIGPLGLAIQWVVEHWSEISAVITAVISAVVAWVRSVLGGFASWWNGLWGGIASFLAGIWSGIASGARSVWSGLLGFFGGLGGKITGIFKGALTWLTNIGRDIVNGLWNGLKGAWQGFLDWWNGVIGGIADVAKKILGIQSPSRVFRHEVGMQIPAGVELGIKDGMPSLNKTVNNALNLSTGELTEGYRGVGMGAGLPTKTKGGDTIIKIENVTLDAKNIKEFTDIVELIKALPQVARAGRGVVVGG